MPMRPALIVVVSFANSAAFMELQAAEAVPSLAPLGIAMIGGLLGLAGWWRLRG